jgi:HK97 family phage prohead protease
VRTNSELNLALEVKLLPDEVRPIGSDGLIDGYASLFGVADLGRDVVERGAFRDSLAARGAAGIRMLWQHDPAEPVGRWLSVREDSRGLVVRGRLNPAVRRAREIAALIGEGALDGLSIGFRVVEARKGAGGIRRLLRLDLWEISIVTFPMLPGARLGTVKRDVIASPRGREPAPDSIRGRAPRAGGDRVRGVLSPERAPPSPHPSPTRERGPVAPRLALSIRRASARLSRPATP